MYDRRYTNMWGETVEEQEKRRQWLRQIYDQAVDVNIKQQQTPLIQNNTQNQTHFNQLSDINKRISDYNQKYQNSNSLWSGLQNLNTKDWKNIANTARQGVERVIDGTTLGLYSYANDKLGGNYQERKKQYQQDTVDAGIGEVSKINDMLLEEGASNYGLGKLVSRLNPSSKVSKIS